MPRIGLLLPNSNFLPRLAADIRRWIGVGLEEGGLATPQLAVETTDYNESPRVVRGKLQDLLIKHGADVVIAPLNPGMIGQIADLLPGQQTPLLVLTMGEDVHAGDLAPPWVFANSFGLWRSAWLTSWLAVQRYGRRVCTLSALHEAGYGLSCAVALGVEAGGGTLAATIPLPLNSSDADAASALARAIELKADAVVLLCSGEAQDALGRALAAHGEEIPVAGLAPAAYRAGGVRLATAAPPHPAFSTWDPGAAASAAFIERFVSDSDSGRPANAYALMAYEAGHLLAAAARACDGPLRGEKLCVALAASVFEGPRGRIAFDAGTQEVTAAVHLLEMRSGENGQCIVVRGDTPVLPARLAEQVTLARANLQKTGWLNPYLIA